MDKTWFIPLVAAAALAVAAGGALAKDRAGLGNMSFSALDADSDGRVTPAELQAHRDARFASTDSNGDGLLSLTELQAQSRARADAQAERMLERLDRNEDGVLSSEELPQGRGARMFDRIDRDGDGAIDRAEYDEAQARMQKRGPKHGDR